MTQSSDNWSRLERLSCAQRALIVWLDDIEFRDWRRADAPGTKATRFNIIGLTQRGDRAYMRRLSPLGAAIKAELLRRSAA